VRLVALALVALALTACESNQERSAKLERTADLHKGEATRRRALAEQALTITRLSTRVKVATTTVVSSHEGAAAIVSLRNISNASLRDVPIQITVRDAHGASVYRNHIAGLSAPLLAVALIPAHTTVTWIDDQVQASGKPVSVSAQVGEGTPVTGAVPTLTVAGAHLSEGQVEGNVINHSAIAQQELVVDAVARHAGRIVAAGRAVIAEDPAGSSTPFQIFLVGNPIGAQLEFSTVATKAG
jgi:hypothetical protein